MWAVGMKLARRSRKSCDQHTYFTCFSFSRLLVFLRLVAPATALLAVALPVLRGPRRGLATAAMTRAAAQPATEVVARMAAQREMPSAAQAELAEQRATEERPRAKAASTPAADRARCAPNPSILLHVQPTPETSTIAWRERRAARAPNSGGACVSLKRAPFTNAGSSERPTS